jgi:exonuclease III
MDKKSAFFRALNEYSKGDRTKIKKMLESGEISKRQFELGLERLPLIDNKPNPLYKPQLKQVLGRLTIEGALEVWEDMTDRERKLYRADIIKKYSNVMSRKDKSPEDKKELVKKMKEMKIIS